MPRATSSVATTPASSGESISIGACERFERRHRRSCRTPGWERTPCPPCPSRTMPMTVCSEVGVHGITSKSSSTSTEPSDSSIDTVGEGADVVGVRRGGVLDGGERGGSRPARPGPAFVPRVRTGTERDHDRQRGRTTRGRSSDLVPDFAGEDELDPVELAVGREQGHVEIAVRLRPRSAASSISLSSAGEPERDDVAVNVVGAFEGVVGRHGTLARVELEGDRLRRRGRRSARRRCCTIQFCGIPKSRLSCVADR